jgi:predicted nucleic acid-binding protein
VILLDTDVMIDILRGYQPAKEWLASAQNQEISVPGLVAMELLQGCQNAREQKRLEKALNAYPLYWAEPQDCTRALKNFAAFRLSHQLGLLDALIAETAVGFGAQLATFNAKHYNVLKELKTIQPYQR